MTITLYVVHIYERGRYVRTTEDPKNRLQANRYAKTWNALHVARADSLGDSVDSHAIVEAIPVQVNPPEREPTVEPIGPGVRPTRRTPALA